MLLPLVELVTQARLAVDTVIDELSQQTVETILDLSAEQVAGARTPGKASGPIRWHGRQRGRVSLADRQMAVERPRLRHKGAGQCAEVPVPAYQALRRNPELGRRMFGALLRGVSTRQYRDVLPQMAQTLGVSKSAVSREAIEASTAQLTTLLERRGEEVDLLAIYIDGQQHGEHHVISAVGVDSSGKKHVLGLQEGATENAAAAKALLIHLREHGVSPEKKYLFILDGAKALRAALREVFGAQPPVQRCRKHIVGRDPRLPEGWNVPSRASPYESGSLGSDTVGQLAVSKQTRHVSLRTQSGGTGKRSGRTTREGVMAPSWHLGQLSLGESGNRVVESPV
jgi:transposase-like protein